MQPQVTAPHHIAGVTIRQDAEGRYCLNDLHRAAGGEKRHQPSDWLRTKQALDLIAEISNSGDSRNSPVVSVAGRHGAPTSRRKLVCAYDTMTAAAAGTRTPRTFSEALRLAADQQEQLKAQAAQIASMQPQVTALHHMAGVTIRQDFGGRYSLNDLHTASGGAKQHQPANWFRLDATKALIEELARSSELRNAPVRVVQGGAGQGTYVEKELVYAYAMWVSARFHITVIRAYDSMATAPAARGAQTFSEALRLAADPTSWSRLTGAAARATTRKSTAAEGAAVG